jgi:hypothetical protein
MKNVFLFSILFCIIALPALGELTDTDLNRIRLIIEEEIKPIKADIVSLKTDVAWIRGKLENVDKQITHVTYVTYGVIGVIILVVGIPQITLTLRSGRDRSLERQIEVLTREVETLKQQRIVNP